MIILHGEFHQPALARLARISLEAGCKVLWLWDVPSVKRRKRHGCRYTHIVIPLAAQCRVILLRASGHSFDDICNMASRWGGETEASVLKVTSRWRANNWIQSWVKSLQEIGKRDWFVTPTVTVCHGVGNLATPWILSTVQRLRHSSNIHRPLIKMGAVESRF